MDECITQDISNVNVGLFADRRVQIYCETKRKALKPFFDVIMWIWQSIIHCFRMLLQQN